MRPLIALLLVFFNLPLAEAQVNLVPNPSFEDTVGCPANISGQFGDEIYNLTHWFPAGESPDYFNSCAPVNQATGQASVPFNGFGFQYANHGNAYVGLYSAHNFQLFPNYREYIGVQLTQVLSQGTTYYLNMKVSCAWGSWQGIGTFSNKIGILLSNIFYESQLNPLLPNNYSTAHYDSIITDTLNWTTIKFTFTADSNYIYLYLGNFFNSQNTDTLFSDGPGAYYYIDDICLSDDSTCSIINNVNEDWDESKRPLIFPNPVSSVLQIYSNMISNFVVFNYLGQVVFENSISKGKNEFDVSFLSSGYYILKIDSNSSEVFKIIKL